MYTDFRVQNFRTFHDLQTHFSPVTLVSGGNNSGKTALLEAAFLHASGPLAAANAITTLHNARGQGVIALNREQGTVWDSIFHDYNVSIPVRLSGSYNRENVDVEIIQTPGSDKAPSGASAPTDAAQGFSQTIRVRFKRGQTNAKNYVQTVTQQPFAQTSVAVLSLQIGGISFQLQPPAEPFLRARYLATRTRSSQAELAERYSSLRVSGRTAEFVASIKEIEPRLKALEVLVRDGQPVLHADIGGAELIPLPLFGEGMVAAVDFMSAIYQSKGGLLLIDEIENGIHYSVLEKVWWQIKRAAQRTDTQVIATTHSRECLEAALAAFKKETRMLGLLRLWRDPKKDNQASAISYDGRELQDALDLSLDVR